MTQLQNSIQWTCHFVNTAAKIQFSHRGAKMFYLPLSNPTFLITLHLENTTSTAFKWKVHFAFAKPETRRLDEDWSFA